LLDADKAAFVDKVVLSCSEKPTVPTEESLMEKLTSSDYYNLAQLVTRKLYDFMRELNCEPPVDVVIVGSDDNTVAVLSITEAGEMRHWNSPGKLLTARFPIRARITDAKGKVIEMTLAAGDLAQ
jgi:hypothetical protein